MKTNYLTLAFLLFSLTPLFSQTVTPDYYDGKIYLKIKNEAQLDLSLFFYEKNV